MSNKELVEYFLSELISKDINKNTYESYKSDLAVLLEFAEDRKLLEQDGNFVKEYTDYLRQNFNSNGVYRKIASLKLFYKKLHDASMTAKLITEDIKNYRLNSSLPEILTEEEVKLLLDYCENAGDEKSKRDILLIRLLYETGIKLNEALTLEKENIADGKITLKNKNKNHILKISSELSLSFKTYFEEGMCGDILVFDGLTRQNFFARIKKSGHECGIKKEVSPMKIRNSSMYNMIERGESIKTIKDKLEYSNIGISSIYKIRNKSDIKNIYDRIAIGDWDV